MALAAARMNLLLKHSKGQLSLEWTSQQKAV
jgi:hypothetical protein